MLSFVYIFFHNGTIYVLNFLIIFIRVLESIWLLLNSSFNCNTEETKWKKSFLKSEESRSTLRQDSDQDGRTERGVWGPSGTGVYEWT